MSGNIMNREEYTEMVMEQAETDKSIESSKTREIDDDYDDRDYGAFSGKPKNRGFKKFRELNGKRREKENKPVRKGRDTSFLDE